MIISHNWLNTYLPQPLEAEKCATIMTSIGLEVEGMKPLGIAEEKLAGLVVGEVLTCEKHPNADALKLTTVDVGTGEILRIVCGAPNVAAGQKVVVAIIGTELTPLHGEPFRIKKAKIRGEESMGMLCAADEIGLGEDHEGIIILPADAKTGGPVAKYFSVEPDTIFEVGLTPNRTDAMSHFGVAR
ncbi:MAG: phenylalanine--tRNA ligase subunit beta, partial [Chitinophagaceae bacterium]